MRLARVLGAIGRGLISAGVIVLLFVAYQLWGTGLQHSAAQSDLNSEFEEETGIEVESDVETLLAAARERRDTAAPGQIFASDPETVLTASAPESDTAEGGDEDQPVADSDAAAPATPADQPTTAELFENDFSESERQDIIARLYPDPGEAFARVVIPSINVDQISVEGVSVEDLRKGPGHYRTTPNPGQAGNAAIAGHRTTYGAPFHRVDELKPDDAILVTTAQGVFEYRVLGFDEGGSEGGDLGYFIVSPSDTWVLDQGDRNLLTLTACHPKYSARQRIIVQAELVGEPAATIPRDEAVEIGAISLQTGDATDEATSERADGPDAVQADVPPEEQVIIDDDVAADDDPSVDADGNPIEDSTDQDASEGDLDDDAAAPDAATDAADDATDTPDSSDATDDGDASSEPADDDIEEVAVDVDSGAELTAGEGPLSTDDFGEGLNGDPTKVKPAILWGIAGLFIWVAAWFMGRAFDRKWTLYAIGLVPFGLVLWSTFVNVDQALPSY